MPDLLAQHLPSLFGPGRRTAWRRRVARRLVAALALCLGLTLALEQHGSGPTRGVVVAARSVAPGTTVHDDDVRLAERPVGELPVDAITRTSEVVGQLSTVAISTGEVLTSPRVLGERSSGGDPDGRLVTLPLTGPVTSAAVGDHVDVHRPGRRSPVAKDARVVAVPRSDDASPTSGASVVLAMPAATAADLVASIDDGQVLGFVLATRTGGSG